MQGKFPGWGHSQNTMCVEHSNTIPVLKCQWQSIHIGICIYHTILICNSKYKQSYLIHTQVAHIHASTYQLIGKKVGTFLYQDQSGIKNWTHQLFFTMVLVYVLCTSSQAIHVWTMAFFMKGAGLGMGLMHLCAICYLAALIRLSFFKGKYAS